MSKLKNRKTKITAVFLFSIVILLAVFTASIFLGSINIPPKEVINGLFGNGSNAVIIRSLRIPRALGGMICGGALAVSGLLLQSVTSNDLCAPNIIGINSGAGFAVLALTCFFPGAHFLSSPLAFLGAITAAAIVVGLSSGYKSTFSKTGIVLSGVAVSAFFGAGISFLSLRFPDALPSYTAFSVGGLNGVYFNDIAPVILPVIVLIYD